MSIGIPEIILIVVVVLLLFGTKRIPELARSLGKAQNEYKKAKDALKEEAADLQKTVEKAAEAMMPVFSISNLVSSPSGYRWPSGACSSSRW